MPRRTSNFAEGSGDSVPTPDAAPKESAQEEAPPVSAKAKVKVPTGHRLYAAFARSGEGMNAYKTKRNAAHSPGGKRVGNNNQAVLRRIKNWGA